ncbi:MAG: hypothetical protein KBA51_08280 [Kiritimatiellae bacterium]|nr:hypothetical protein [Kiritimatiellia bacterium]
MQTHPFPIVAATLLMAAASFADENDVFSRPGVTAHRAGREVRIEAQATGLATGEPCEFLLVGPRSGHGYEAFAISKAAPSDVHAALLHIGLVPGECVNSRLLRFWPRGQIVSVRVLRPTSPSPDTEIPIEEFVWDRALNRAMETAGFMFTGSLRIKDPDLAPDEFYAADLLDPGSILSVFNQPETVLDIPRQGGQSELYGRQTIHPERVLPKDEPLTILLRPAAPGDNFLTVAETTLHHAWKDGKLEMEWSAAGGFPGATGTVAQVDSAGANAFPPKLAVYAAVTFDRSIPLRAIAEPCAAIERWVLDRGLRISPPNEQHLFYRAFIPLPEYRERGERPSHPLEIQMRKNEAGGWAAEVTRVNPDRDWMTGERTFRTESWTAASPAELAALAREQGAMLPVLIVIAPDDITYGDLVDWLLPARATHPVAHIYAVSPSPP